MKLFTAGAWRPLRLNLCGTKAASTSPTRLALFPGEPAHSGLFRRAVLVRAISPLVRPALVGRLLVSRLCMSRGYNVHVTTIGRWDRPMTSSAAPRRAPKPCSVLTGGSSHFSPPLSVPRTLDYRDTPHEPGICHAHGGSCGAGRLFCCLCGVSQRVCRCPLGWAGATLPRGAPGRRRCGAEPPQSSHVPHFDLSPIGIYR